MSKTRRFVWPLAMSLLLVWLVLFAPGLPSRVGLKYPYDFWLAQGALALSWLVGAYLVTRLLDWIFWNGVVRSAINREPPRLMVQLLGLAVYLSAFAGILAFVFHRSVTALWATSGAVGIVVGFALRNLILDTFSGLAIHLEAPFKVGDWINVNTRMGDMIGRVEETNWRTTRLWTTSRNMIIVPNSFMTTTVVINYSLPDKYARFEQEFVMDYFVPTERVIRVLGNAMDASVGKDGPLADPPPKVRIDAVTDDGIHYKVRYYLDPEKVSPGKARHTVITKVMQHLHHSGLSLTYPKRDVYMTNMPWRQKDWDYHKDQVRQLRRLQLFKAMSEESLQFLATHMKVHTCRPGQQIVEQDDEGTSMYIVGEGLLDVTIKGEQGRQMLVGRLEAGDFFGEASLLTGEPRSATVTCASNAVIAEINRDAMSQLLAQNPEVAEILSIAMAERALENDAIREDTLANGDEKLESEAGLILARLKNFFRLG